SPSSSKGADAPAVRSPSSSRTPTATTSRFTGASIRSGRTAMCGPRASGARRARSRTRSPICRAVSACRSTPPESRALPSLNLIGQSLVAGLFTGGLYALLGLGLSLTWGLLRVINLANFALAFLGAYLTYQLATALRLDPILTLAVIVPAFFVAGIALEEGFLRLQIDELTSLIVTFGLTVILESLIQWIWTADFRRLESPYMRTSLKLGSFYLGLGGLLGVGAAGGRSLADLAGVR